MSARETPSTFGVPAVSASNPTRRDQATRTAEREQSEDNRLLIRGHALGPEILERPQLEMSAFAHRRVRGDKPREV